MAKKHSGPRGLKKGIWLETPGVFIPWLCGAKVLQRRLPGLLQTQPRRYAARHVGWMGMHFVSAAFQFTQRIKQGYQPALEDIFLFSEEIVNEWNARRAFETLAGKLHADLGPETLAMPGKYAKWQSRENVVQVWVHRADNGWQTRVHMYSTLTKPLPAPKTLPERWRAHMLQLEQWRKTTIKVCVAALVAAMPALILFSIFWGNYITAMHQNRAASAQSVPAASETPFLPKSSLREQPALSFAGVEYGPDIVLYPTVLAADIDAPYMVRMGYMDVTGTLLPSVSYDLVGAFNEGLATVVRDGRLLYINTAGEVQFGDIIPFHGGTGFNGGYAMVALELGSQTFCGVLSAADGTIKLLPEGISYVGGFSEGLAPVQNIEGLYGYVDNSGELVVPFQFTCVLGFSEGLAAVAREGLALEYINTTGETVLSPAGAEFGRPYAAGACFSEGYAYIGGGRYINTAGEVVISIANAVVYAHERLPSGTNHFSEGLAALGIRKGYDPEDTLYGYVNTKGEWVIEPQFLGVYPFSEGRAVVVVADETQPTGRGLAVIDETGEILFSGLHEYYSASAPMPQLQYQNGLLWVVQQSEDGFTYVYLDHDGNQIYP